MFADVRVTCIMPLDVCLLTYSHRRPLEVLRHVVHRGVVVLPVQRHSALGPRLLWIGDCRTSKHPIVAASDGHRAPVPESEFSIAVIKLFMYSLFVSSSRPWIQISGILFKFVFSLKKAPTCSESPAIHRTHALHLEIHMLPTSLHDTCRFPD